MSTDAAGRRYIPAPLHVDVEQADAEYVVAALAVYAFDTIRGRVTADPDGVVDLDANLWAAEEAAAMYRTAAAVERARLDAVARRGKGRPGGRR